MRFPVHVRSNAPRWAAALAGTGLILLLISTGGGMAQPAGPTPCHEPTLDKARGKETPTMPTETQITRLPPVKRQGKVSVEEALWRRRSVREYATDSLSLEEVGQLLWAAQGITDPRQGFRTAPSAGATYPLEVYVMAGKVEGLSPGLYKYDPKQHALKLTLPGDGRIGLSGAALGQEMIRRAPASLVIAAVIERTASKYGERAVRYVDMEVGHAAENVYLQCVPLNLGTVVVGAFDDASLKKVLHLLREETPLYIMPVGRIR